MVNALLECKAVSTLVNSAGFTALEIALSNNTESDILDALRLAEARDMENIANGTQHLHVVLLPNHVTPPFFLGVKNKALRKQPPPPAAATSIPSSSAFGSPSLQAMMAPQSPMRRVYVGAYAAAAYRPHLATNATDIPFHLQENEC